DPHISGLTPINERSGLRWLIHLVEVGLIETVILTLFIELAVILLNCLHLYHFLKNTMQS
ncbi:MAG: hypothetical protein K0Q87_4508, partial [Neobacillus sp.]|nr:hypothetical protein [Neobacillus sp.]